MSFATSVRNRNSERALALIAALAMLLSMMVVFAETALAHHPTTVANQACVEGELVIQYTSESWLTTGAAGSDHPNVVVEVSVAGGDWVQVGSGAYSAPNYSFSGSFNAEAYVGQSIRVRSQVVGDWPNSASTGNTNGEATTAPFTVTQQSCGPDDVETSFSISGSCVLVEETATFTISGELGAGLTLNVAGQTISTAGPFSIDVGAGGDYDYSVTVADGYVLAGGSPAAGTVSIDDCTPPPPPSGYVCVNGEVIFIPDTTNYQGTVYPTAEAAADAGCTEVGAATTFTISGTCAAVDGVAGFTISGNLGEGVTLEVAGQTLTATGAFSIDVGAAGSYPYTVTLDDGFELAAGSPAAAATIVIEDCTPTITIEALGVCVNDAPWLYYSVEVSGDITPGSDTVDIRWFSAGGVEGTDAAHSYLGLPLNGTLTGSTLNADGSVAETITNANRVPWVGLRLAGDGVTPVDWPGWVFENGTWVQQDDGFAWARESGAYVEMTVNPTGTSVLAYPPSTPTCSANPPDEVLDEEIVDEVEDVEELPFTGIDSSLLAAVATVLLGTGFTVIARSRRREEDVQ